MKLSYKILTTGYHYARATDHHHLYAQWSVGSRLSSADVSFGEYHPGFDVIHRFVDEAQRVADTVIA